MLSDTGLEGPHIKENASWARTDYLDYRKTLVIRLLMIAGIFVYHAGSYFGFTVPNCGHTCVAVFFFMSGFGLEYSLANKRGYMRTFLQKRVLGMVFQYWIIMIFCAVLTGIAYMSFETFVNDAREYLFEYVNWYILELLVFYVVFFLSTMISDTRRRIIFVFVLTVAAMLVLADNYGNNVYYKSGIAFVLGILWYRHKDAIDGLLMRYYPAFIIVLTLILLFPIRFTDIEIADFVVLSVTSVLTVVVSCMILMADLRKCWYIPLAAIAAGLAFMWYGWGDMYIEGAMMLFLAGLGCVMCQVPVLAKVGAWGGAMSLELFLLHYITYKWTSHYIDNVAIDVMISVTITVIISYVAYIGTGRILRVYNKGVDAISTTEAPKQT